MLDHAFQALIRRRLCGAARRPPPPAGPAASGAEAKGERATSIAGLGPVLRLLSLPRELRELSRVRLEGFASVAAAPREVMKESNPLARSNVATACWPTLLTASCAACVIIVAASSSFGAGFAEGALMRRGSGRGMRFGAPAATCSGDAICAACCSPESCFLGVAGARDDERGCIDGRSCEFSAQTLQISFCSSSLNSVPAAE